MAPPIEKPTLNYNPSARIRCQMNPNLTRLPSGEFSVTKPGWILALKRINGLK
jgi:hypothetical protein